VEGVFHLAGIAHLPETAAGDEALYQRVNVAGTQSLLDAAQGAAVPRFIYFSSVKAAGQPGDDCVDEHWDPRPDDAYGLSKREAEKRVHQASGYGIQTSILRPTLVYGAEVKGNLKRMMDAVAVGRFPPLPEVHNRRSMVSVRDLSEAAWLAMTNDRANGRTYIVADGIDYSTRALYVAMCNALGRRPPSWCLPLWVFVVGAQAGDWLARLSGSSLPVSSAALERLCGSACYRADRIRRELGWASRDDFYGVVGQMVSSAGGRDTREPGGKDRFRPKNGA
jgi:nucleoside-diphosphate-sugar epimerase